MSSEGSDPLRSVAVGCGIVSLAILVLLGTCVLVLNSGRSTSDGKDTAVGSPPLSRPQEPAQTHTQAPLSATEQAKADALERVAYGALLQKRFWEQGADLKVTVSGKKKDRLRLKWVLFNDVWRYRMAKEDGIVPEAARLGFRRVDIENGYD